ncbi:DUF6268 family outer membrane beta-barrel protein [Hymenobacter sp. ASUV-10]|uniref:DUF6268 family outer membrane beta-barrel protein n=1 Tax=Hymenobacter aranciens TaxID=3063996 RepID=A0ABT9BDQ3_9BACT|nr:DUF6268 family outer membrane beta-barrel protein [Hymenobacter sp. ASUV-10]MDO7875157.1 DUF6268 family outer membrane beta-barrel protein [Hymenobacter sp. ASUV-10]
MTKLYLLPISALLLAASSALAQTAPSDTTKLPPIEENFDQFGDASAEGSTSYNTQKVLYISPTKLISVGYEAQLPYDVTTTGPSTANPVPAPTTTRVDAARGIRLAFNAPVISRNNFILNLGLTYWNTGLSLANPERSLLFAKLDDGLRTTGFNATVFKPFDSKHFLLLQGNVDANGNYRKPGDLSSKHITYSGTAIFGWKPNDNLQWGVGASRTYRAGQLLYIPVLLYNRTFSPKWGCEVVFPARAELRRNFGTTALLKIGYELEGNAYYLGNVGADDYYLRRGELKPRLTYERQLVGFIWVSAQAGLRYNYRNDVFSHQNPTGEKESLLGSEPSLYSNKLTNPLYFNLSVNLVSP